MADGGLFQVLPSRSTSPFSSRCRTQSERTTARVCRAGKRGQQSREEDYDRDARIAELEAQQAAQPAPAPAAAPQTDMVEQLQKLAALKDQGILTQAEFDAQKAKLLAGVS